MRTHHHFGMLGAVLAAAVAVAGCGAAFSVETPEGMVSLKRFERDTYYKAVTPDNSVATITAFKHRDRGSLEFWSEVLKREMATRRGYKLLSNSDVKTRGGVSGKQFNFTAVNGQTKYRYQATLFVTSSYIYVVQVAAREGRFARHKKAFEDLVASFRPK